MTSREIKAQLILAGQNALAPFVYQGINILECIWINGEPWFTRTAIGKWLEYAIPRNSILRIEQRHPHIKHFSRRCQFDTSSGIQEHVVYNFIGLQLIIAFANRPQRDIYLVGVAHALDALRKGQLLPSRWCKKGERLPALQQLLSAPAGHGRRANIVDDIAQVEGKHPNTVYRWVKRSGEQLLTKSGRPRKLRSDTGKPARPEEVAVIIEYRREHPGAHGGQSNKP